MPNSYNILLVGGTFSNTANLDGSYGAVEVDDREIIGF